MEAKRPYEFFVDEPAHENARSLIGRAVMADFKRLIIAHLAAHSDIGINAIFEIAHHGVWFLVGRTFVAPSGEKFTITPAFIKRFVQGKEFNPEKGDDCTVSGNLFHASDKFADFCTAMLGFAMSASNKVHQGGLYGPLDSVWSFNPTNLGAITGATLEKNSRATAQAMDSGPKPTGDKSPRLCYHQATNYTASVKKHGLPYGMLLMDVPAGTDASKWGGYVGDDGTLLSITKEQREAGARIPMVELAVFSNTDPGVNRFSALMEMTDDDIVAQFQAAIDEAMRNADAPTPTEPADAAACTAL